MRKRSWLRNYYKPIRVEVIGFPNLPNPSSRNMNQVLTVRLTEMSTKILPGFKARQARKAENFTAICVSAV
jgi:hypothetical protein